MGKILFKYLRRKGDNIVSSYNIFFLSNVRLLIFEVIEDQVTQYDCSFFIYIFYFIL